MSDPGNAPEQKAKKDRDNHSTNNTIILMACMAIAFFLWLFVKLSNNYPGQLTAHIIYSNLPEGKVLVKPLDKQVKLRVETTGVKLLLAQWGIEPVYLNIDFQELHNSRFVLTEDLKRKFAEVLPVEMRLYSISPDTLLIEVDNNVKLKIERTAVSMENTKKVADTAESNGSSAGGKKDAPAPELKEGK